MGSIGGYTGVIEKNMEHLSFRVKGFRSLGCRI